MKLSRRQFTALLGAGAAGAFVSPGLLSRVRGQAAGTAAPMRFLAVRSPHGADRNDWIPRMPGGAEPSAADMDLMELTFEGPLSVLPAMMPWRHKISVLDGLDTQVCKEGTRSDRRTFHGHNEQGCMLTGAQPPADRDSADFDNHPSLDFYLHGQLGAAALITASVEGAGTWKCMSYDDNGLPRAPESNPQRVFDNAFSGYMPPAMMMQSTADPTLADRKLLAHNVTRLRQLRDRLGGAERQRLDVHIAAIESRIPAAGQLPLLPGSCGITDPASARPGVGGGIGSTTDVETVTRTHAEVIANAFACGVSRVATLQILNDYPNWYTELPEVRTAEIVGHYGTDNFRFHENLVHDYWGASGDLREQLRVGYTAGLRWSGKLFASVLEALDAVRDPQDPAGGTILDNTIVYWHNEFGHDGHDAQETRHPTVIAGGGGRVLRLGRYLRLRNIDSNERVPHNRLLTSIAQAMGVDIDYFGDRDLAGRANYMGPLTQLMA